MEQEDEIHPLAQEPFRRFKSGKPPSDRAIALAVWGRSHCQYHNAANCQLIEDIIEDAEAIERGEPSWYDIETARYDSMG